MTAHRRGTWFVALVLAMQFATPGHAAGQVLAEPPKCRLPVLEDEAAWQRLPTAEEAATGRLPVWVQALAGPLPRTTAALLELDYLYRTSDAFDARLRARMRWAAARANQCVYAQRYAEADLKRLGVTADDIARLEPGLLELPPAERAAVSFARKLTLAASTITDQEVAELESAFGEQAVVAMVLQMAYANFQDRLLLTLDASVEPDGPLPPLAVHFAAPKADESIAAERPAKADGPAAPPPLELGADWSSVTFEQLVQGMEQQRARPGRVSVPEWKDVQPRLPAGDYRADRPVRIRWSLVVLGHQPTLGAAWLKTMRTFGREANQDRVFEETLFWVITRSIDCFY